MPINAHLERMRWLAKKAARRGMVTGVSWGSVLVQQLKWQTRAPLGGQRARVRAMTYHRFGEAWPRDAFCVTGEDFEAQMRWLAEQQLAISLSDLEGFLAGKKTLRDGSVLVTMDDGVQSVSTVAAPILQRYQIPAVAYITTDLVGNQLAAQTQPEPYMSWSQVERLREQGLTVGSHACSHRSLGQMSAASAEQEAERSKATLETKLGCEISSFAYPFGTPGHYSSDTTVALKRAGYQTGFLSVHGPVTPLCHPLELPRVKVEGGESLWMFQQLCQGGMDPWAGVDYAVSAVRSLR